MVGRAGAILLGIAVGSYITGYAVAGAGWVSADRIRSIELALAGVIRKLKEVDFRTKDLNTRVGVLERKVALLAKNDKREEIKCRVVASWLRIRNEPSLSSPVTGYLKKGVVKKVLEKRKKWYRVEEGWIYGRYCKEE